MRRVRLRMLSAAFLCAVLSCWPATTQAQGVAANGVSCVVEVPIGARRYRAGSWGLAGLRVTNPTDAFAEAQGVLRVSDDLTMQFSRRVVAPPQSVLWTSFPVRIPDSLPPGKRSIEFLTDQILPPLEFEPGEKPSPLDVKSAGRLLPLDDEVPSVGMIVDPRFHRPQVGEELFHTGVPFAVVEPDAWNYEMMVAAKRANRLSRRISLLSARDLVPDPACLDMLDVLMLCTDDLAVDPAGTAVVRDWVLRGGHLWIALDDVRTETVSTLMGDAFDCHVVDRVEVTHLTMRNVFRESPAFQSIELEEPVRLVRVIPGSVTMLMTVGDDWPAAFWQPFGEGRVFFTTLGPAAWMRSTTHGDPPSQTDQDVSGFYPRPALADLAGLLLNPRHAGPLTARTLEAFLSQQIGYRILGRSTVAAILAVFCLLLGTAVWWTFRRGRADRLLWMAPAIATALGLVFVVSGVTGRRAVPPTVAAFSRVVLERGVTTAHSSGLIAMYNQDASSERLGGTRGGVFFPDMEGLDSRHRRITWSDEGVWDWELLELPSGVRTAPFERPWELSAALDCRVRLGPSGLHGYVGPLPTLTFRDALIALPSQQVMAVSKGDDGAIVSGVEDVLPAGEYLPGALLNDERLRRRSVYESVLAKRPEGSAFTRPMLFWWGDPAQHDFVFPQPVRHESVLFSIPLRLERSPPGTEVAIPTALISCRGIPSPEGSLPAAYGNIQREWIETKLSVADWLRFQMPPTVLPLQVHRATISLTIRAPSRAVEILAPENGKLATIARLSRPIGSYQYTIERPELLQLDAGGGMRLVVRVGADPTVHPADLMAQLPWRIEKLQLEVNGTVQGE